MNTGIATPSCAQRIGQTPNPFIDPDAYLYEIAINEQAMGLRLEEQWLAAGGN